MVANEASSRATLEQRGTAHRRCVDVALSEPSRPRQAPASSRSRPNTPARRLTLEVVSFRPNHSPITRARRPPAELVMDDRPGHHYAGDDWLPQAHQLEGMARGWPTAGRVARVDGHPLIKPLRSAKSTVTCLRSPSSAAFGRQDLFGEVLRDIAVRRSRRRPRTDGNGMSADVAELGRGREGRPAIRAGPGQRGRAFLAEPRRLRVVVLAPGTLHAASGVWASKVRVVGSRLDVGWPLVNGCGRSVRGRRTKNEWMASQRPGQNRQANNTGQEPIG
jgi:hypothetical protein